jgi:hypothetical protein
MIKKFFPKFKEEKVMDGCSGIVELPPKHEEKATLIMETGLGPSLWASQRSLCFKYSETRI